MIRIKSIYLKLFLTYIAILIVSHLVFAVVAYLLFRNNLMQLHLTSEHNQLNPVVHVFVLTSVISIPMTGFFTYFLSKRMTAPFREMNRAALQIARGQFDQRVQIKTHDELGELGATFNYMAQELAGLDQMRKDFVANVSHDLRSPLTSIHGYVRAFLDDTVPDGRKRHYLTIMNDQTERMIKLVNDLLDMARIEAGQMEVRPVVFNLSELVRQVVARMEPEFVKAQVQVELILREAKEIRVVADPDRMDQVLVNLIQNAVQVSPPGHPVEVILEQEEQAVISIRDFGPGIRAEDLDQIWERFYKADRARTKKAGTGIGLAIVKHLLDLHKSHIQVKSEVGKGAIFTFTLPLAANMTKPLEKE